MKQISLKQDWELHEAPLYWGAEHFGTVKNMEDGWMKCNVPVDIHMPLIEHNIIKDPILRDYSLDCEWTEKRSWWFKKTFSANDIDRTSDRIELVLEGLDAESMIFLNGQKIGEHHSVHFPFVYDIKDALKDGDNELIVRLTSGLEKVTDENLSELNWGCCVEDDNGGKYRGDKRRSFVRRPMYTIGWDWGPKAVTTGITGDAYIRCFHETAVRDVWVKTKSIGTDAVLEYEINVEDLDIIGTRSADIRIEISDQGKVCAVSEQKNVLLTSGYNYIGGELLVKQAKLWWPNGYGEHPLYKVNVTVTCNGKEEHYPEFSYGIRTIRMNTEVIQGEERMFQLIVNDLPIFCKGGNWIPNDSIYARVPREKYEYLLDEAIEANFNMIRIWGGGLYEREYFYEMCSERGILLWHDFMLACSTYPDHRDEFCYLMEKEFDYQTRRLRNHASMAIWCGTNEIHWLFNEYDNPARGISFRPQKQFGMSIPNHIAKEMIRKNCSNIPYWNSSPYGGATPNSEAVGDVHHWGNAFMSHIMAERIEPKDYDKIRAKFVSEYGYVGPCCMETTRQYMDLKDGEPVVREGRAWEVHKNVFEKDTVAEGIHKNYGLDPDQLSLEEYILYGGAVHGMMYNYSLETMRFRDFCSGALFWMYNDTWGEIGWTIIDYYLRRKIPFYGVKRALAHKKMSMRAENGMIRVQGLNDTTEPTEFDAEFGYVSFDGTVRKTRTIHVDLEAHCRRYILEEALPEEDYTRGSLVLIPHTDELDPIMLRTDDTCKLDFTPGTIEVLEEKTVEGGKEISLTSKTYVHGAYIDGEYKCSDNYFDMIPGCVYKVKVYGCGNEPLVVKQIR